MKQEGCQGQKQKYLDAERCRFYDFQAYIHDHCNQDVENSYDGNDAEQFSADDFRPADWFGEQELYRLLIFLFG